MNRIANWFRSEWRSMLLLIILALVARSSLADHYYVPSGSMEYSLMPGDRVVVNKTAYGLRVPFTKIDLLEIGSPRPGEIAVFDSPKDGTLLIKRIVAVGGDYVQLREGKLWIDGLPRSVASNASIERHGDREAHLNLSDGGGPDIRGLRVPDNMVLVLGDHRGNSFDGRFFGLVPERELYGRAIGVYYRRNDGFQWRQL
jgi:signal peptidase I